MSNVFGKFFLIVAANCANCVDHNMLETTCIICQDAGKHA